MLILIAFILGAFFGWRRAKRRGGDRFDGLQYAAVHAILFALLTMAAIVVLQRLGVI
ncbi:apolipoprotein acyltransferase [Amaricoccus macauensis]|uniref:apolipoprotein acyltransferase n=1 Tax=Amaricoccus macauensis TaxID=57001 RepID=UPI003C7E6E9E